MLKVFAFVHLDSMAQGMSPASRVVMIRPTSVIMKDKMLKQIKKKMKENERAT